MPNDWNWKLTASFASTAVLALVLLVIGRQVGGHDYWYMLLYAALGVVLGWPMGIMLSPYDSTETKQFAKYSKAMYGVITGYILGKTDPLLRRALDERWYADPVFSERALYFLAFFVLSSVTVYVFRAYA